MKIDFYKNYGTRILFVVVFLLSIILLGTRRTLESNSNAVEDWLPSHFPETKDYQWFLRNFPFENFIVVSWEGCQFDEEGESKIHEDRIELFAQKLVPNQTIDNFSLTAPEVELVADLDIENIEDRLDADLATRPERERAEEQAPTTATPGPASAKLAAAANLQKPENYFRSVMTGPRLARLLEESYSRASRNLRNNPEELHRLVMDRISGLLVGPDHKSTAMLITLNTGFKGGGKQLQEVIDRVKEISVECGFPDTMNVKTGSVAYRAWSAVADTIHEIIYGRTPRLDGLIMGGPPIDNVALDHEGTRTLYRLAGICAIISLLLALIALRNFMLTMYVFWVAIIAAGLAMALVSFTGGRCDSILLSMPALIYVMAMSGSIHMVNYYHDAIRDKGLDGAVERAVKSAFPPTFVAQLTTAIGLGSLFTAQLVPIVKFGFYSAVGIMTTLLLLFFYLPALLSMFPQKKFAEKYGGEGLKEHSGFLANFWLKYGRFIVNNNHLMVLLCLSAMIFFGANLPKMKPSVKMMDFFSEGADILAHYTWLEEKLGPLVPMEVVLCFDNARLTPDKFGTASRLILVNRVCNELKNSIRDKEDDTEIIGGALSVATFTPDIESICEPDTTAWRFVSSAVGKSIEENRDALKDYLTIGGNAPIAEIIKVVEEEIIPLRESYVQKRSLLTEKLSEEECERFLGLDASAEDFDLSTVTVLEDPSVIADTLSRANVEDYQTTEERFLAALRLKVLLETKQPELEKAGVTDLKGILEKVTPGKPFRPVTTGAESTELRRACRLWQEKRGIELWRISIRVWSLKKQVDYSELINQVKGVVQPMLGDTSKVLMADLFHEDTDKYDYLSTAGLSDIAPSQNILAGLVEKEADLSYLETDDPLLQQVRADFKVDSGEEGDTGDAGVHSGDIIFPAGISAKYTGTVPLVYKTQHALINGLVVSIITASLTIAVVFAVYLRSISRACVAMIPNVFPVIIVFGFMGWAGVLIDVGTMMTASVALGVAVDNTCHYLTWFTDGINKGMTRKEAAVAAYGRCAPAMTEASMISGVGLSAFMFSTFVPTQRFGLLMLSILFVSLIGDMVFLASLLTGPLGRFFCKDEKKRPVGS
ncbi:MAG: efflux RND transporter permease subunit [Thermoguttaceae bacterium]